MDRRGVFALYVDGKIRANVVNARRETTAISVTTEAPRETAADNNVRVGSS